MIPSVLAANADRIYVNREWGGVEACSVRTGKVIWSCSRPRYVRKVVAGDTTAYVIDSESNKAAITTLQVRDGSLVSSYPLQPGVAQEPRPLAVTPNGTAYLLRDRRLVAIRLEDGHELWSSRSLEQAISSSTDQWRDWTALEYGERRVILAFRRYSSTSRMLHVGAFDPPTGELLWEWQSAESLTPNHIASLVMADDTIYVRNHEYLYALSAGTGNLLWKLPATGLGRLFTVSIPEQ
jgi:outer membrane protein assembly factor BamB